jgi:anti-sigma B factor antagonist
MDLDVKVGVEGDVCVVTVSGEVDVYTSPTLRQSLHRPEVDGATLVIVVLDDVGFIDSSGLGVLVGALRRVREAGGDLRVVCAKDSTVKVFKITGLDRVFPIFPTIDEARGE